MNKVLSAAELQPAQPSAVQIPAPAKSRRSSFFPGSLLRLSVRLFLPRCQTV